ncbi:MULTISPECIES: hypothetical protein [Photorhabdus]|uniref:CDI immunity protein domain-containing protein n=4 Tax=Photorhabdus TaxID=29487 RepID=A0A0F7LL03_9GAMM|nr:MULTISPECIES: hypothetical protein [Photorhabdus]AKH62708.1 hypothetical protein VY86_04490 [Photorhabdus thracensis]ERT10510.1 hypothetical protein O185_24435 [Photorhabdus temperata J3]KER03569.1 hypothetical protein MEG1DRAFT_01768 [Photorhabdus temperata subsp. temperata Meg1]MCT8345727.1 hypothetical protein [Photorhabdus temperata]
MNKEQISWLMTTKDYLYQDHGRDLYDVIYATLSEDKMSYKLFLKMASEGHGFSPSEGFSYALDQDWDIPEEFNEVTFFLGEYESLSISPNHFVQLMQYITDAYIQAYPNDKASVELYMEQLRERYP